MRKGQVTAFIVIGLILLVLVGVVLYLTTSEAGVEIGEVKTEVLPLQKFVENCLDIVSKDALLQLGSHGGYVSLENSRYSAGKVFRYSPVLTESDSITLVDGGEKIPYWFYMSSKNDCTTCEFKSAPPTINEMETMMDNFIEDNMNLCIRDFKSIQKQGFDIISTDDLEVKTKIAQDTVNFQLSYPIDAKIAGQEVSLNDYFVVQPVDLRSIYDMALRLHDTQAETPFLEYTTLHVISAHSKVDSASLPPMSDSRTGPGKVFWSLFDVEDKLREQISQYTPLLTIEGSQNFYPPILNISKTELDVLQGSYFPFIINILPTTRGFEDIAASFNFIDTPTSFYFDINPREGAVIKPSELGANLANIFQFFLQRYRFTYDLSYPVLVELRDTKAFNGEGYSFTFALESNIRANSPLLVNGVPRISASSPSTLFTSEKQKISGEITVTAISDTGKRLEGVDVHYLCANDVSYIGKTNDDGVLVSRFPICSNGEVMLEKIKFLGKRVSFNTHVGRGGEVIAELMQIRRIGAKVNAIPKEFVDNLQSLRFSTLDEYKQLLETEMRGSTENLEAYLTLTREGEPGYTTTVVLGDDKLTAELVPGKYSIIGFALDLTGQPEIPKEIRTIEYKDCQTVAMKIFGGCKTRKMDYELPAMESRDKAYVGGIQVDDSTIGLFDVTLDQLLSGKTLELQIIRAEVPKTHDDLLGMFDIGGLTKKAGNFAKPRWK